MTPSTESEKDQQAHGRKYRVVSAYKNSFYRDGRESNKRKGGGAGGRVTETKKRGERERIGKSKDGINGRENTLELSPVILKPTLHAPLTLGIISQETQPVFLFV